MAVCGGVICLCQIYPPVIVSLRQGVKCSFISVETPLLSISNAPRTERRFLPGRHFSIYLLGLYGMVARYAVPCDAMHKADDESGASRAREWWTRIRAGWAGDEGVYGRWVIARVSALYIRIYVLGRKGCSRGSVDNGAGRSEGVRRGGTRTMFGALVRGVDRISSRFPSLINRD